MQVEFNDEYLSALYEGKKPKGKPAFDKIIIKAFVKTISKLIAAKSIEELYPLKSLNFEALQGNSGLYSVRVNDKFRIEFTINEKDSITILTIHKLSKHYQ